MSRRAGSSLATPTFVTLWRESWFFRVNVLMAVVGVLYLIYR